MKYSTNILLVCSLLVVSLGFGQRQPKPVSLIELVANPQRFDGALVSVRGYLVRVGGDHDMAATFLYLHKEDADNQLGNSIVVGPSDKVRNDLQELDRKYVTLTGTFRAIHAANDSYIPEITQVQLCALWSDPDHPIGLRNESGKSK